MLLLQINYSYSLSLSLTLLTHSLSLSFSPTPTPTLTLAPLYLYFCVRVSVCFCLCSLRSIRCIIRTLVWLNIASRLLAAFFSSLLILAGWQFYSQHISFHCTELCHTLVRAACLSVETKWEPSDWLDACYRVEPTTHQQRQKRQRQKQQERERCAKTRVH